MTAAVAKILEEVKSLSPNEREAFRHEIADLFSDEANDDFTPEELAEIDEGIARGEVDFAAGRFYTAAGMRQKWGLK